MDPYAPRRLKRRRSRALTLGELILLNRLRDEAETRRALAHLVGRGAPRHHTPHGRTQPETRAMAPRVGFAGLGKYHALARARLDQVADAAADKVDAAMQSGLAAVGDFEKQALAALTSDVDDFVKSVQDGSNSLKNASG